MTRRASTLRVLIVTPFALMLVGGTAGYSGEWFVSAGSALLVNSTTTGSHTQARVARAADGWAATRPAASAPEPTRRPYGQIAVVRSVPDVAKP